ncbi:lipocalin-like domain-containing protein [Capnocytophaga canimorsus]|uniref:lipocalin family protein n=1 Tax=Capnocytophaga canimorsus TaxID=28188 RepID=UPI000D6E6372|nr:lipocalin family protein [Capnocytophaga canimorsus]AWL77903.1 hypothetical protein DKB58_02485 [Capnocytophaga canimorsus]AYW36506.1 hypothetical protein D8L92_03735 [Capnocytophaga canimorsus]
MKKILTSVVAILAVSLYSCGKDDKKNDPTNPLIGEWALQSQVEGGKEFKEECQEYTYFLFTEKDVETHQFIKKGDVCVDNFKDKYPYTISNNQIHGEVNGQKASIPFSVKDDILTITLGTITQTYKKNARKTPPAVPTNPFIGTWKLETFIVNGKVEHLDECQKQSTYVFTDTNLKVTSLNRKNNSTECETTIEEISYSISENKIVMRKGEKNIEYTFLIKDNTLTFSGITEGDIAEPFTITLKKQ